ncbi:DUF927 domain-containing protein [Neobacillus sp. PS3-40]|uniref:DUF927 domain-containing protein n=1 Tax=Neobacillus sp. PS3-40 TaxID=3070679 RepID=UPI0027E0DD14|nr:DUF927 domain-containing protein [Neobacillus sp. PS3-40]WML43115.1 DUF927 domain-containing protein [Neobacillus sp. PS3-40]
MESQVFNEEMEKNIDLLLKLVNVKAEKNETIDRAIEESSSVLEDSQTSEMIPKPFLRKGHALYKQVFKNDGVQHQQVTRTTPWIIKELSNLERNSIYFEIAWRDRTVEKREFVPASTLSTKSELIKLSDNGFPVNDLNSRDLIHYFDQYLTTNKLEQVYMVERLGQIKDVFIHPLKTNGIIVVPNDFGDKQLLEGFEVKGTVDSWIQNVFNEIKQHPKTLLVVLGAFTSVVLNDLKLPPFIIDIFGPTSEGKTTAMQVSRSVWGNENLLNEWNLTHVAVERKAGFLNSFPLYLDDTRKAADEGDLKTIVYQFSGGRAKGRGSLKGSQLETTWRNILISSGEVPLTEYAKRAGGVAARIIPLFDSPFEGVDHEYFTKLYKSLNENYGAIGLEFLNKWLEEKDRYINDFFGYKKFYSERSKGNVVLTRLSLYYAAIHFVGYVLNRLLGLEIDLNILILLFDEIKKENKAIDQPKQILEEIIEELDSSKKYIFYGSEPDLIKAVFHAGTLGLTPSYLKQTLGPEEKMIRREWMKKGYTIKQNNKGQTVDYVTIKPGDKSIRVIMINPKVIEELGFNFSREGFKVTQSY